MDCLYGKRYWRWLNGKTIANCIRELVQERLPLWVKVVLSFKHDAIAFPAAKNVLVPWTTGELVCNV